MTSIPSIRWRIYTPPGLPLATNADPAKVNDEISSEAQVEAAVRRLCPHRAGIQTHLRAEYLKQWKQEAYPGEKSRNPLWSERWLCLVDIVYHMWGTG